eukprot:NODE_7150_length_1603_cov_7.392954.p1 GENE.NODE_7150_length_1603_cov_7.392954~~NODE_7150_length_1603_cov_7.392954.p1  ORF type:complete len:494 (+),score=56.30 NODE_7150_length_1603_cov_7.392954:153-1484(+)
MGSRFAVLCQAWAGNGGQVCVMFWQNRTRPADSEDPCRNLSFDDALGDPVPAPEGEIVLVTGGAGFIGSHLVEHLLQVGYVVRVFDNLETGNINFLPLDHPRLSFFFGNISDRSSLAAAMAGVRGVFHLAAASKVAPSLKDPSMATFNVEVNALGTATVLEVAHSAGGVKKVVYTGSSTYYGNQATPFAEDAAFGPSSPYGASKYMGELQMATYDIVHKLPTLSLRLFMVYGPRNPMKGAYAVVTGLFVDSFLRGEPLTIEGSGEQSRDFIHVKDGARGLVLAYQSPVHGTVINLGSGTRWSVKELADLISPRQRHVDARPNDLRGTLSNTCRAKHLLHFRTRMDLPETIRGLIEHAGDDFAAPFWSSPAAVALLDDRFPGWDGFDLEAKNKFVRLALNSEPDLLEMLVVRTSVNRDGGVCDLSSSCAMGGEKKKKKKKKKKK